MENPMAYGDMFHGSGLRLRIAFPLTGEFPAASLAQQVAAYLAHGFAVREVGVEPGEESEEVGFCLRVQVPGQNGPCSRMFFYSPHEKVTKKVLDRYLNTAEDVADFERATGLVVAKMPIIPGKVAPDKADCGTFLIRVPKPGVTVICKKNPKYVEGSKDTGTARLFVRFGGQTAAKAENVQQNANTATGEAIPHHSDDAIVSGYETEIEGCQGLMDLGRIGFDIKNHPGLSDGGRTYLRGIYDGRKKYLEAMANNSDIPW